jgi:hypothetical protein
MLFWIKKTHLLGFLLELFDGTFVNATALVDQVTSGGRLARVDVANDHNVDMGLFLRHFGFLGFHTNYSKQ